MPPSEVVLTVLTAVLGSGGLWGFLQAREAKRQEEKNRNSLERQALLGLLYDRIMHRCKAYINRGYILPSELEDFLKYLCNPYVALGGDGTAEAMIEIVKELPHRKDGYEQ